MIAEGTAYLFPDAIVDTSAILGPIASQVDWGDGSRSAAAVSSSPAVGPITVRFDFSTDTGQFFNTPEKRAILQTAADMVFSRFSDSLSAIIPSVTNTWSAVYSDPTTGAQVTRSIGNVAANELVIFVGSRVLPGNAVALAGPGGSSWNGAADWGATVVTRGQVEATNSSATSKDFGPWGGSLTVNPNINWHFGATTEGLDQGKYDFLTAISHEFMHILGFGVSPSWKRLVGSNGFFLGQASANANSGQAVPLDGDLSHWREGFQNAGQETLMDPTINNTGIRKLPTPLDLAGLVDVGWIPIAQQARIAGSQHTYGDDGNYTPKIILSGARAGERSILFDPVVVTNVAPMLNPRTSLVGQANVPINIVDLGVFQDPGFGPTETFVSFIDWGDGSQSVTGAATIDRPGSAGVKTEGSFDGLHTYSQIGSYIVRYRVTDDNGGIAEQTFSIQINSPPEIKLTLDRTEFSEAAGDNAATLQIDTTGLDNSSAITFSLISNDPSEATLPVTVVIPAGSTRASVGVNAVDDNLLDGPQTVQFTATLNGLSSQPVSIQVLDREIISATLNVAQVREDAGPGGAVLRVTRSNTDNSNPLEVLLSSTDIAAATVLRSVTIPGNASSIDVSVTVIDDSIVDGVQNVVFTPEATGYFSSSAALRIIDYEPLQWVEQGISLAESPTSQPTNITIKLPAAAPAAGVTLHLSADLEGQLQYPPQVVVAAGQTTATVSVSAINDTFAESPKTVKLSASATGFDTATIGVLLTDDDRSIWTNPNNVFDTNNDGSVGPIDVLQVINALSRIGTGLLPNTRDPLGPPFVDVNGDGVLAPVDVLIVINALSRRS